jgi:hypothetical protein
MNYRDKLFNGKWIDYCHPSAALFLLLNDRFSYTIFWNVCNANSTPNHVPLLIYVPGVGASSIVKALS